MSSDRYKAELIEDEGVSPRASGDEPTPLPPLVNPFDTLLETILAIKKAIDAGDRPTAMTQIKVARTIIGMGFSIAESRHDGVLKTKLDGQKKLVDEQEARL
jgi:hypothetical protein